MQLAFLSYVLCLKCEIRKSLQDFFKSTRKMEWVIIDSAKWFLHHGCDSGVKRWVGAEHYSLRQLTKRAFRAPYLPLKLTNAGLRHQTSKNRGFVVFWPYMKVLFSHCRNYPVLQSLQPLPEWVNECSRDFFLYYFSDENIAAVN